MSAGRRPRSVRERPLTRLSTVLYLRPRLALLLLLLPPLLWLGIVYLGSLLALLAQSFFSVDDFSGLIVYQPTLKTYAELFTPANVAIILRTVAMAAAVTLGCAVIAFPLAYYMARFAGLRAKAIFYLAVMLPLWSNYLVRVYSWKLILAKEGVHHLAVQSASASAGCSTASSHLPVIGGPSLSASYIGMWIVFIYIWLPYMILPIEAALERVPRSFIEASADLGARPRRDLPPCHPAAGHARRGRRLDLHLLADAGRLHHPQSDRQFAALRRAWSSMPIRAPRETFRSPPPSPWCRSW